MPAPGSYFKAILNDREDPVSEKKEKNAQQTRYTPASLVPRKLRQEGPAFENSLVYMIRLFVGTGKIAQ